MLNIETQAPQVYFKITTNELLGLEFCHSLPHGKNKPDFTFFSLQTLLQYFTKNNALKTFIHSTTNNCKLKNVTL